MNLKSFCMSWKTTSRYSGWMPSFILSLATLVGRPIGGNACLRERPPRPRSRFFGNRALSAISGDRATGRPSAAPAHHVEELGVVLRGLHLVQQEFHRLDLVHAVQQFPQDPDLLQDLGLQQQF